MTEFTAVFSHVEPINLKQFDNALERHPDDDCDDMLIWDVGAFTTINRRDCSYSVTFVRSSDFKEFVEIINKLLGEQGNE